MDNVQSNYFNCPTGSMLNAITEIISCGSILDNEIEVNGKIVNEFAYRKMQYNHDYKIEVYAEDFNNVSYTFVHYKDYKKMNDFTIGIQQNKFISGNKPKLVMKMWIFLLKEIDKKALSYGKLVKNYVSFHLNDLVDHGIYQTIDGARRGYKSAKEALNTIIINGWAKKGKGKNAPKYEIKNFEPLFSEGENSIVNGICVVDINKNINWNGLSQYYMKVPNYFFWANYKSGQLLIYICYLSRQQNTIDAESIHFNVSIQSLYFRLNLPNINGKSKDKRRIQKIITNAILDKYDGLLAVQKKSSMDDISIEDYLKPCSIGYYLENGYISVTVTGELAKSSIEMAERKNDIVSSYSSSLSIDKKT